MPNVRHALVAAALALVTASPARAAVQAYMTVEGPRGPFATRDPGTPSAMKLQSVQVDFAPGGTVAGPPRPIVLTRAVDELSWQFLDALRSNDQLRVVVTIAQKSQDAPLPLRRVLILSNARIVSIHAGMDASGDAKRPLGTESITLGCERLDVEDDGVRVFTAGG